MKRKIFRRLCLIIIITMLLTLLANFLLQVEGEKDRMIHSSQIKINQIHEILVNNAEDMENLTQSLKEDSIIRAKAAAFILEHHPEMIDNRKELEKIASLLQIDELHIFDDTGCIYAGTQPQYYGYTVESGEQIGFFKDMLENKSLELAQDITPNTAEGKYMQYSAVWQESGDNIIQVGMEPLRWQEAMKKNELSYIFSMVTAEEGTALVVINKENGIIQGSTRPELTELTAMEAGIDLKNAFLTGKGFRCRVNGTEYYAYFEDYDDTYIGVILEIGKMYTEIGQSMILVFLYLTTISVIMIAAILKQIDRNVIRGIDELIEETTNIIEGNLETKVNVTTTPEFEKLSGHINRMVGSLLSGTDKLSRIFEITAVQIGVFEYSKRMKHVRVTRQLRSLWLFSPADMDILLEDRKKFELVLQKMQSRPVPEYKDVYQPYKDLEYYLKIQSYAEGEEVLGIVSDMTKEVLELRKIRFDRDYDLLTELLNRRGFYQQLEKLFEDKKKLGSALIMMMDMNRLKYINDTFGHASGDVALKTTGELLKQCSAPNKIVARLSGDEFAMVLYGEDREILQGYLDELHEQMLQTTAALPDGTVVPIRVSGGYLFYPEYDLDSTVMLNYADRAMYRAKREGNADFALYDPNVDKE